MYKNSTRPGILITSFVMTALVASSISMAFISINPQGMSGYQTGGNPILKYVTASSEGEGGGEGEGDGGGDQGTSVGGEISEGEGIETTNEEDTDVEDEEQQQPTPGDLAKLAPSQDFGPNIPAQDKLCQTVPSLCNPLVLPPGNLIPGIPIGGLPTKTPPPTPTSTPPPLFGRNVPLQGGGIFGQQPAAIVPPSPVLTPVPPVLTPEPPVPMFGSAQDATPTPPPQFGQIAPQRQVSPSLGEQVIAKDEDDDDGPVPPECPTTGPIPPDCTMKPKFPEERAIE
jgi:hypothetical protein